ncbi:MAG: NAD-dependent epimerase/dehydratase family protein [Eubacteriales bacterium]|nr:NAD-dependent epimerase/dehydratase family protein [Eubacteriales bacterium]
MKLLNVHQYKADLKRAAENANFNELDGRSVFITGGLGLIGSSIADMLVTYGKTNVYIGARNEQEFFQRFGGVDKVGFIPYDALGELKLDFTPDYIIHGAGPASPELYTAMPTETLLSNFGGVHELLKLAKENGVKRLLYISSSEVYGKKLTDEPFIEGKYGDVDIDSIRSSYIIGKRSAEMLCKAYSSEYDVDTVIVRPGHIFGPAARRRDKRISSDFAFKAVGGENLEMKSAGTQKRSYCYSVDCAVQILTVLIRGEKGQAYNIGHDEITTVREMAAMFAAAAGVELTVAEPTEAELKAFNPMNNSALDNSRVRKLGYTDTFSVEEGIRHTVDILREMTGDEQNGYTRFV